MIYPLANSATEIGRVTILKNSENLSSLHDPI